MEPYMSDEADRADYFIESVIDDHVKEAMRKAAEIPKGNPGECDGCGEWFGRLVDGYCGRCRDRYNLSEENRNRMVSKIMINDI
jgi:hypothetical protein